MAVTYIIPWTYDLKPTVILKELFIHESARGEGIGKALMKRVASYAVPTDEEVDLMLEATHPVIGQVLLFCLLTGMWSGEATGLLREDLAWKGNLGWFAQVRPNRVRLLKTDAAERLVPLHGVLADLLPSMPDDRLFPDLTETWPTFFLAHY